MANKNIKGITIEIGGDTTKLGKALEATEKKSRSLQAELREIQQALKFNPNNVELLAQKQTVLTQSIEETSNKLDTLKEAERQVIAQFERGEVAEEQVRALQREIIKTENQLASMRGELDDTTQLMTDLANGTQQAGESTEEYQARLAEANQELEDFKGKASETFDTLKTGALAIGASAVAIAGYAVNLSDEFDKAFNTLQTQTGATAEEMEKLEESVTNIYRNNFGENIEDVAQSMATVKTQTKLTGQELEDVTQTALLMRDVFGFEVDESIRGANALVTQFGISAEEAYTLIAQGAQNGLNKNGDLMDIVNEYSLQFKDAGYNAEDMFNMLANGAKNGAWSVDMLGDAVKEYNIRMSDGTAIEYLEMLGLNADQVTKKFSEGGTSAQEATNTIVQALKGVENEQDRYIIGQGIMGTMWEDLGEDAVYALLDTQGEISKTSDALEQINEVKYDDIGSAIGGLKRTLETDIIEPLGDELKPVVEDVIGYVQENGPAIKETLSGLVKSIGDFVKLIVDNGDFIIATIVGIATGMLAWNVVTMIQGVVTAIKAFKLANEGATVAQWALNVAMNANPIGIVIALIVGLVTAFVLLWKKSEAFRNFWIGLWEGIVSALKVAWSFISDLASGAWDFIKGVWSGVSSWFKNTIISPVSNFFSGMWDKLKSGASSAWKGITSVFSNVTNWFRDKFSGAWNAVKNIFSSGGKIFSGITEGITSMFKKVVNAIIGGINKVISVPFGAINGALNIVRGVSVAGLKPFSGLPKISTPQIPMLYRGGILKKGQVGLLEGNGAEAVIPLERTEWINRLAQKMNAIQSANPSGANVALASKMDEMIQTVKALKSTIVLDTGVLVGETINQIDEGLGTNYTLRGRRI